MRKIRFFVLVLVLFVPGIGLSADYDITVCSVQAEDRGNAFVKPCSGWVSKNGCAADGYITWKVDTDAGKAMYSTALTALTTGFSAKVRMDGTSCSYYDVTNMIRISK